MFNRHVIANPPELAEDTPPAPAREKRPAHEADCFQPSSFASRKAEAEPRVAHLAQPRLVSMGLGERWLRDAKNQPYLVEVDLFCDANHPMRMYFRVAGDTVIQPMFDEGDGKANKVEPLGTIRRNARFAGRFEPSPDDPAPRPV